MASKIPLPENLKHCLIQFIKNKQNQRIGVLVAIPDPNAHWYRVGWSACHKYLDTFDREKALAIAFGRAQANSDMSTIPKSLWLSETYHTFMDRCDAYYKEDLPATGEIPVRTTETKEVQEQAKDISRLKDEIERLQMDKTE